MPTLRWLTRDEDVRAAEKVPYRLLEEVPDLGYGDRAAGNMLIQGDNLEALKALLPYYAGQVKCIYIDPPYNTGQAFDHYDDNLEHSIWLGTIFPRLEYLRDLLTEDGVLFCQLNDDEAAYAKVLLDEVFGRQNFINQIAVKMKLTAGASGGGEDKRLKKNVEHILIYAKNNTNDSGFQKFNDYYEEQDLFEHIEIMEEAGKSWKYTSVIESWGEPVEERTVLDGSGGKIIVTKYKGLQRTTLKKLAKKTGKSERELYIEYFDRIFSDTNAQTSIRTRIIDEFLELENDEVLEAKYIPRSGRDKGKEVSHYYISPTIRRVIWLSDAAEKRGSFLFKKEKLGTYWQGFSLNNLTKEGSVKFPNGKKPEGLLERVMDIATAPGDLVLDSFLGSGTTAAVAHKLKRRYIGIEMGEHAVTHCVPRLQNVTDGEQGGISKAVNWEGGGGFRFYRLGPPVFHEDGSIKSDIRFPVLAAHIWFAETGAPWTEPNTLSPFLGAHDGHGYALLYNGILGGRSASGGNVLTRKTLAVIRAAQGDFKGPLTVYGERTALSETTLKVEKIEFKQTPYDVRARK
ncbi:adenine-specific DNA-methyltransferase [Shimia isoporae]|uniref:site-specific DNA-methyltransferase (adenine-specific) n=1 Tax=Shimia isoporae TaxID=647720 RepID=A0A4R1N0U4_9RHOB|nr:site-specific DNA-methyltransferase [Shimia isoporae]TCK99476.1 adenine-specific DNA-methyltransferase [Shimia isoporae]